MGFIGGTYLGKEICAFSGDWIIVYDGKWNYMLFDTGANRVISCYNRNRFPYNDFDRMSKDVEYYSTFDNALDGLAVVLCDRYDLHFY